MNAVILRAEGSLKTLEKRFISIMIEQGAFYKKSMKRYPISNFFPVLQVYILNDPVEINDCTNKKQQQKKLRKRNSKQQKIMLLIQKMKHFKYTKEELLLSLENATYVMNDENLSIHDRYNFIHHITSHIDVEANLVHKAIYRTVNELPTSLIDIIVDYLKQPEINIKYIESTQLNKPEDCSLFMKSIAEQCAKDHYELEKEKQLILTNKKHTGWFSTCIIS